MSSAIDQAPWLCEARSAKNLQLRTEYKLSSDPHIVIRLSDVSAVVGAASAGNAPEGKMNYEAQRHPMHGVPEA